MWRAKSGKGKHLAGTNLRPVPSAWGRNVVTVADLLQTYIADAELCGDLLKRPRPDSVKQRLARHCVSSDPQGGKLQPQLVQTLGAEHNTLTVAKGLPDDVGAGAGSGVEDKKGPGAGWIGLEFHKPPARHASMVG